MAPRKNRDTKTGNLFSASQPKRPPAEPFIPGPNPKLQDFINEHSTPFDSARDNYEVGPFTKDIAVDKATPPKAIYDMHTYWSKKHWAAIREYIRHYLPEKFYPKGTGLVLDCFSGSGMTGVASMMEDHPCILIDASPAAAFISHCYTHPVDLGEMELSFDKMMNTAYPENLKAKLKKIAGREIANLQQELDWLYETKCDRCGGPAKTEYVVYSERFQCPNCGDIVALYDCPEKGVAIKTGGKEVIKKRRICPHCLSKHGDPRKDFVVSARTKKHGAIPVLVSYTCLGSCSPKRGWRAQDEKKGSRAAKVFKEHDLERITKIEKAKIPHWYPNGDLKTAIPYRLFEKMDFRPSDAQTVEDLFSKRNLWALASIKNAIGLFLSPGLMPSMQLALNAALFGVSRMVRESNTATLAGTYYLPQMSKAVNVVDSYTAKLQMSMACYASMPDISKILVSTQDARSIKSGCKFDYIFTDPPYVDKIQYGELNYLWESWLGVMPGWRDKEIIVNSYNGKSLDSWDAAIRQTLTVCYEILKPGRWMSLCYHDTDPGTWTRLQNAVNDTGFEIHSVTTLDPKQKSQNQLNAEKIAKGDLVLNCRKPRQGELQKEGEESGKISQRVRDILIETLSTHGGQDGDKLWDVVLKRLLTRGQMAEHRFGDVLAAVATQAEGGRWYLKEEFQQLSADDLKNEEHAGEALMRFARLRCAGVPSKFAATLASEHPKLCEANDRGRIDEDGVEKWINANLQADDKAALAKAKSRRLELGGRLPGMEFYDALFFYLTKYMKNRRSDQLPKRNLTDFLEEYLVRFADGDKWLYRAPFGSEEVDMRKARQSGLGRRIRVYCNALRENDRDYTGKHRPDAKTFVEWMRYCAAYGHYEDGATLYDQGGLTVDELQRVIIDEKEEETAYDAARGFADLCKRRIKKTEAEDETEAETEDGEE